jgi:hypothetical protein
MARLKEKPVPKGEFSGPRGPTVVFNFGHGLPVQSMKVVGVEDVQMQDAVVALTTRVVDTPVDDSGWPV